MAGKQIKYKTKNGETRNYILFEDQAQRDHGDSATWRVLIPAEDGGRGDYVYRRLIKANISFA